MQFRGSFIFWDIVWINSSPFFIYYYNCKINGSSVRSYIYIAICGLLAIITGFKITYVYNLSRLN